MASARPVAGCWLRHIASEIVRTGELCFGPSGVARPVGVLRIDGVLRRSHRAPGAVISQRIVQLAAIFIGAADERLCHLQASLDGTVVGLLRHQRLADLQVGKEVLQGAIGFPQLVEDDAQFDGARWPRLAGVRGR